MSLRPVKIPSITSLIVWNIEKSIFPIVPQKCSESPAHLCINSEEKECALAKKKRGNFWWSNQKSLSDFIWAIYLCDVLWKSWSVKSKRYIYMGGEKNRSEKWIRCDQWAWKINSGPPQDTLAFVFCCLLFAWCHRSWASVHGWSFLSSYSIHILYPLYWSAWWCYCCVISFFRLPTERLMSQTKSKTIILSWSWEEYAVLAGWAAVYVTLVEFRE